MGKYPLHFLKTRGYRGAVSQPSSSRYQNYRSTESDDPYIQQLEQKVSQLILRIQEEEKKEHINDKMLIASMKTELDFVIAQRDRLYQRVIELSAVMKKSQEIMDAHAAKIKSGSVGFGIGAAISVCCSLSPELTVASIAAGTVAGICVG